MKPNSTALAALHSEMQSCRLCLQAGYDIYPRAIFSGTDSARIMLIGQAPGITEKEAGRPFNAGSGTRLFQWLAEAGIQEDAFRKWQYMTSVTKCYPGRGNGSGDRVPSKTEQELCAPYLSREISIVNPTLIIPVGRLAIGLYFPKKLALTSIIGREMEQEGRWIIPLPHPSGASRWHQTAPNRALIDLAVQKIHHRLKTLSIERVN